MLATLLLDSWSFIFWSSIFVYLVISYFIFWFCLQFCCYIEQVEAERSRVPRRASTTWEEDTEMKELEYVDFFYYYIWHLYKLPLMIYFGLS